MKIFGCALFVGMLIVGGCDQGKAKPAEGKVDGCREVMARLEKQQVELQRLRKESPPKPEEEAQQRRVFAVMATRCEDDKWSAEALACFGKATSAPELQKCDAGLSEAQRESLSRDISVVFGVAPS